MQTNKEIVISLLKLAIQQKNSELPINAYIKFMDLLPKEERDTLLLDNDITKLIDTINRYHIA